ncbi:molybdenum cofactor guanylyltransferase [Clostridium bowmanii]|uniref:molybdenum cofactor guanylyltransferase n=1 Tax=Clostridium bowmanii TaxID=132925 RepID=UPI001C0BBC01|nr:molybdenum cofactor guanylyltransferase [Clostridium bowmanii]MBU3188077.1 molybdenum cofactor guanylyltransferase [Clostridium bowmanii]MCA1072258.1 molybdenum cofactor guanylyltransferase [Clostridium bowmanii]
MKDFGSAVILCGGKSIRMGFDKCKLKVKNRFLIDIIAEQLEQVFENIVLVSNDLQKFNDIKYTVVEDIISNRGPIGAIYTALKETSSKYVFITACDMPIINLAYIKYMMELIKSEDVDGVVSCNSKYIEPLYAFYSTDMINNFENEIAKDNFKLIDVIKNSNMLYVEETKWRQYCNGMDIFTNLNYESDLTVLKNIFMEDFEI